MDLDILYIKSKLDTRANDTLMRVIMLHFLEQYRTEIVMEVENQLFILLFFEHKFLIYCLEF